VLIERVKCIDRLKQEPSCQRAIDVWHTKGHRPQRLCQYSRYEEKRKIGRLIFARLICTNAEC
jgi:hypothetical protein